MDYAVLPPEVNSARMYAGAGSAPMLAAAAGWDRLAAALASTENSYRAVLTELTDGSWQGNSASAMAAAAEPYLAWMNTTAAQAAQTANQARATAAAYEAAFAATVPPSVIAANRAALATLLTTNVFGQNTAAIAANQADYSEMWAQDAAAMHTYAANTAAAAPDLNTFTAAPQTTNPAAAGASPGPLTQLAQQIVSNPTISGLATFISTLGTYEDIPLGGEGFGFTNLMIFAPAVAGAETAARGFASSLTAGGGAGLASSVSTGIDPAPSTPLGASAPTLAGSNGSGVSAGLGRAAPVGRLSVPPAWGAVPQRIRLAAAALPTTSVTNLPEVGMAAPGGTFGGMPPVASVVNAPSSGPPGSGGRSDSKANPKIAGAASTDGTVRSRPVRSCQPVAGERTSSEREELGRLHQVLSDLAKERDALERSADSLLRLAGLGPVSGRR